MLLMILAALMFICHFFESVGRPSIGAWKKVIIGLGLGSSRCLAYIIHGIVHIIALAAGLYWFYDYTALDIDLLTLICRWKRRTEYRIRMESFPALINGMDFRILEEDEDKYRMR